MAERAAIFQPLYENGTMREPFFTATCGAFGCDSRADHEVRHTTDDGQTLYVPFCEPHVLACRNEVVEYQVVSYGFIGASRG